MSAFTALIARELRLGWRAGGASGLTVAFFLITVTLFPLAVGPDMALLARIAPGILWVAALLASLLSLDRLFQADFEDGSLEQLALAPLPLPLLVLGKCLVHWLLTGVPLLLALPIAAILLDLPAQALLYLSLSLALGTPTLSLIGAIGAGLTVAVRRASVLISLLSLPLFVPPLIFGVAAVEATLMANPVWPHLQLLGACLLFALALAPWATAAALRLAVE